MNNHPDHQDQPLTQFLRQYRPIAPPGRPDLEQQILAQLPPLTPSHPHAWSQNWSKILGLTALMIAATVTTWITSDRAKFQPTLALSPAEEQEVVNDLVKAMLISSSEEPEESIEVLNF